MERATLSQVIAEAEKGDSSAAFNTWIRVYMKPSTFPLYGYKATVFEPRDDADLPEGAIVLLRGKRDLAYIKWSSAF